ncbi:MAG TPA: hypothetical protein VF070_34455 [Streptosporangiaceae bacterium]
MAVLCTVPAAALSSPAASHRRSVRATSAQTARAQNSASEYSMDSTIEPGAAAQIATVSTLIRGSPVSFMTRTARPHAAASPAIAVTANAARAVPMPGSQASESIAAG